MLVGGAGVSVICTILTNTPRRRAKLRRGRFLRLGDHLDEGVAVEGINLVESDHGNHQAVAYFRRGDGVAQTNDDVNVVGARCMTYRFHQQIDIRRIARSQQISFHPRIVRTQLPHQITVLALRRNRVECLLICFASGGRPSTRLCEFLFRRQVNRDEGDLMGLE